MSDMIKSYTPKFKEICYDSGKDVTILDFKFEEYFNLQNSMICRIPTVFNVINPLMIMMTIEYKIMFINKQMQVIQKLHQSLIQGEFVLDYWETIEEFIFHMKRVIDILVILAFDLTYYDEIMKEGKIAIDSYGTLSFNNNKNKYLETWKIINGDENFEQDKTGFLPILNNLFNSMKHCIFHEESRSLYSKECPTIVSFYMKNNKWNDEILYYNINANHFFQGFQDNVIRIMKNIINYK